MEDLKQCISILEARYGTLENMKFLLGSDKTVTKEDVAAEMLKAMQCLERGEIEVRQGFPEPGLNDSSLLADMLQRTS